MRVFSFRRAILSLVILAMSALRASTAEDAPDTCQAAGWDMRRELLLFHGEALRSTAGTALAAAPVLDLNRLYALDLHPQSNVQFATPPERAARAPTPTAGLSRFAVVTGGKYRVTVDAPVWIDVIAPSGLINPRAFNGWHQCSVFRKSVEYTLQAGQSVVLQLSDAAVSNVKIVVELAQ